MNSVENVPLPLREPIDERSFPFFCTLIRTRGRSLADTVARYSCKSYKCNIRLYPRSRNKYEKYEKKKRKEKRKLRDAQLTHHWILSFCLWSVEEGLRRFAIDSRAFASRCSMRTLRAWSLARTIIALNEFSTVVEHLALKQVKSSRTVHDQW